MLLAIDIGNSQIHFGLFNLCDSPTGVIIHRFHLATQKTISAQQLTDEILNLFASHKLYPHSVKKVMVSSVVPPLDEHIRNACDNCFKQTPLFLSTGLKTGLIFHYSNPSELGSDRIANAVAGHYLYEGSLIIVDFGTATTYCVITQNGDFLGGLISLGLRTRLKSLSEKASRLPDLPVRRPEHILGKTTIEGMLSGAYYGSVFELEGTVSMLKSTLNLPDAKVIATGGLAHLIEEETSVINIIEPDLTVKGLEILYYKNQF